jgi:hypothetical protein
MGMGGEPGVKTSEQQQILEEIRRLERDLYYLRTRLAALRTREQLCRCTDSETGDSGSPSLADLIAAVGRHSKGGNSVADVQLERER